MILRQIEQFLTRTGMTPTRFGRESVKDPRLVLDMRRGREPRPGMIARIEKFLASWDGRSQGVSPGQRACGQGAMA